MLTSKADLGGLKNKVDNLHIYKFNVCTDLCKTGNVVDNDIVKKLYDKLVTKVNAITIKIPSTSGLVFKTQYDSDNQTNKVLRR